ncbi:deoxyribodipyrimidine photo-lyase [Ramlibacter sp.]|uniref:cryptochrome/photolyase family protein n=1 Tax=Ramlibacter sp. TaxID=1917967 RepID=UPI002BA8809C|nr:deoxyribodipyrimidine photo-lyase [Ramlibacter sp.]HWI81419.1 deoxyribodipyrimidine photo-lyase [Ramlibacter sp.]
MSSTHPLGLVWFRRDLRAHDHAALSRALQQCRQVHCAFLFDSAILDSLPPADRRVEFIRESLVQLDGDLRQLAGHGGAGLIVCHGAALDEIPRLAQALGVQAVFANRDDEPAALARDQGVRTRLAQAGIAFADFKDHAIFERSELLTRGGGAYTVFTPYRNAWLAKLGPDDLAPHPVQEHGRRLAPRPARWQRAVPELEALGFARTDLRQLGVVSGSAGAATLLAAFAERIDDYGRTRDFPALAATSGLSVHLRFGTVSIRALARLAQTRAQAGSQGAAVWLDELIWRDFYLQILSNFPRIAGPEGERRSFKPAYDAIEWEHGPLAQQRFAAWCAGRTGYPLVDAAMAQINATGFMHNRLRMVVASFLVKDLGIDWRRGESYFARQLLDYDLAANNGGWQWAASTGCDAQPWFRIFNPVTQSRRFDAEGRFIRRWLPQLAGLAGPTLHAPWTAAPLELAAAGIELGVTYPAPIVDHETARQQTLRRYAAVRGHPA